MEPPGPPPDFFALGADLGMRVLEHLDPLSLASASCTCRGAHELASSPHLWHRLAHQRWAVVHENLFPRQHAAQQAASVPSGQVAVPPPGRSAGGEEGDEATDVDWAALFQSANAWVPYPRLEQVFRWDLPFVKAEDRREEPTAIAMCEAGGWPGQAVEGGASGTAAVALTSHLPQGGSTMRVFDLEAGMILAQRHFTLPSIITRTTHLQGSVFGAATNTCVYIASLGGRTGDGHEEPRPGVGPEPRPGVGPEPRPGVGSGPGAGGLQQLPLPSAGPGVWGVPPQATFEVDGLEAEAAGGRLAVLYTAKERGPAIAPTTIRVYDPATSAEVGSAAEVLDSYDLIGITAPPDRPHELLAGSVHSGICAPCNIHHWPPTQPRSLCYHKSGAQCSAMCVFDLRTSTMADRYMLHHRGLHPRIATCRQHYVMTSHAGTPLCVWDRRFMSCPVFEQERLPLPDKGNKLAMAPFGFQSYEPASQALYLDIAGDTMIGCAENGLVWGWDLSACLGWQRPELQPPSRYTRQLLQQQRGSSTGSSGGSGSSAAVGARQTVISSGTGLWHGTWRGQFDPDPSGMEEWWPRLLGSVYRAASESTTPLVRVWSAGGSTSLAMVRDYEYEGPAYDDLHMPAYLRMLIVERFGSPDGRVGDLWDLCIDEVDRA